MRLNIRATGRDALLGAGLLYAANALRVWTRTHDAHASVLLESLLVGWAFTLAAAAATLRPPRSSPPHEAPR